MQLANKIALITPAILGICLFGAVKAMRDCRLHRGATPFDAGVIESGGDYHLARTSPYKNADTDGKDVGCDFSALNPEGTKK